MGGEIICHSHIQSIAIAYGKTKSHRGAEIEILVASQTTVADGQSIGIEAERCAYFYIKKWLDGKSAIIRCAQAKIHIKRHIHAGFVHIVAVVAIIRIIKLHLQSGAYAHIEVACGLQTMGGEYLKLIGFDVAHSTGITCLQKTFILHPSAAAVVSATMAMTIIGRSLHAVACEIWLRTHAHCAQQEGEQNCKIRFLHSCLKN